MQKLKPLWLQKHFMFPCNRESKVGSPELTQLLRKRDFFSLHLLPSIMSGSVVTKCLLYHGEDFPHFRQQEIKRKKYACGLSLPLLTGNHNFLINFCAFQNIPIPCSSPPDTIESYCNVFNGSVIFVVNILANHALRAHIFSL